MLELSFADFLIKIFSSFFLIIPILFSVAYLILFERKIIGFMQLRLGPNVAGPFGVLQPIADAIKLLCKEKIYPKNCRKYMFKLAPVLAFTLALAPWAVIPNGFFSYIAREDSMSFSLDYDSFATLRLSILYIVAIASLEVYGIIIAGWASNSPYAILGCIRSVAQMISYEASLSIITLILVLISGSFDIRVISDKMHELCFAKYFFLLPVAVIYFISMIAESNRHPFDLPEAESELVAGYNVEYSSMPFALFFLGEYATVIVKSALFVMFFLGGFYPPLELRFLYLIPPIVWFLLKILICLFIFVLIRAAYPRYRFDQLMSICWKFFMPLNFAYICTLSVLIRFFNW